MDTIVARDEQHLLPLGSDAGIRIIRPRRFLEILAHRILDAWRAGQFELVTAPAILDDLRRVLGYPRIRKRHGWSDEQIDRFVQLLAAAATVTPGRHTVQVVAADPTDDKILACAQEGQVDTIVASDEQHLVPLGSYAGIPIVRPRQFLEILAQHSDKP